MTRPGTLGELRPAAGCRARQGRGARTRSRASRRAGRRRRRDRLRGHRAARSSRTRCIAGHDVIFLGERGQAKTRMIRSLTDAARRVDADRRRQRDQRRPVRTRSRTTRACSSPSAATRRPIEWVHRDRRFGEKLATPDTSIADLIGEVDPIKVAEGRYLSDELTIHYGLVPRTNRGDLLDQRAARPRRAHPGRSAQRARGARRADPRLQDPAARSTSCCVASANPEDYTNRGRIITPLKDRFGAQIRTHYPLDAELEMAVVEQEAPPAQRRRPQRAGARLHDRDRRGDEPAGAPLAAHQPALRRVGAALDRQLRDAGRQRDAPRAAPRRDRGGAARQRPRRARRRAPRARSSSRPSTTAARSRCSTAS